MYKPKLEKDIRCPLEYGLEVFGGKWKFRSICQWAGLYHKEDYSGAMVHCQKCDFNPR